MKKVTKKICAIILTILMLINYIPIIVNATETVSTVESGNINISLESTASKYISEEYVYVDLKINSMTNANKISQFTGFIEYNEQNLNLEEISISEELIAKGYSSSKSNIDAKKIIVTSDNGNGTLDAGDIICTIKFKAVRSSKYETQVKVYNIDASDNDNKQISSESFEFHDETDIYINDPIITLPVEKTTILHNLKITKVDESENAISNNSALFKITKLDGQVIYKETDENGIITIPGLEVPNTEAPYIYVIEEILAPIGYIKNEEAIEVTVTFDDVGNATNALSKANGIASVTAESNTIEVKILNKEKEAEVEKEVFNLVLNKVDEENNSITTDTAEFTVTMPDGTKSSYSTRSNGKTENISVLAPEEAGTYTYLIKETKVPNGYTAEESNIIVELTYEKQNNKIVLLSGKVVSYNDEAIAISNEEIRTATINIKNEKQLFTYNYSINIDKVKNDTFKTNITEDTAMFEITKDSETKYIKTNQLGKATYEFEMTNKEIVVGQEYTYTIKEIKAPSGYILDETAKTITLTFNGDGSINTAELNGSNIEKINNGTNVVNVKITNEKEPEVFVPVPQDFDLIINKVDENNNLIINDVANFTLTTASDTRTIISTVNGISPRMTLKAPEKAGKQVYFLQETKAPQGYDILEKSLVIEADFIESEGKIVLSNATVREYNKEIIPSNNTLTVEVVNTKHMEEEEPETYVIKIAGVDEEGNSIESGTTVIKLTNKNTGNYEYKEVQIKDGIIELEMPKVEGIANYELEQIKATDGYKTNSNIVQITITFEKGENERIKIVNYTVTGEDASKGSSTDENAVSIIITNDKIKEEPQKQNYSIEINKLDSITKNLITEGSAIFTIVDSKGNTKEYGTTNGKIFINGIIPGNVGENHTFVIKEKVAPEGYKLTAETIIIKLGFEEVEGKILIANPELIMGNEVATTLKTETGNIKIDIINEKEDEDLYVISKKYSTGIDIYDLFTSYTGRQYTIDESFIDTKEAKYGGNVTVHEFINNLESNGVLTILDKGGNIVPNGNRVKTGMTLKAIKGEQQKKFKIIVKGDSNGDGRVTTVDLNMLEKHLTTEKIITDPIELRSLDLGRDTGDGRITTVDVNKFYLIQSK